MSFIKKGLKKIWNFVKKYWKEIVMVAAIVFTAGIATVGVAGFSAAMAAGGGGVGGFFSAVGSTMWAGVTATAGSMGLGSGAAVGEGTAFAAANIAGGASHVGLGAAMGAGGGYGLGAAGKAAAAAAEEAALAQGALDAAAVAESGSAVGVEGTGIGTGTAETTGNMAADLGTAGADAATKVTAEGTRNMAADLGKNLITETGKGMTMGKAMMYSTAMQTAGSMLQGYGQAKMLEDQNKPLAAWGVATKKGGRKGGVEDYLFEGAVMQPLAGDVADAGVAANALMQEQMGAPAQRAMGGALMTQPGQPLQFADREAARGLTTNPMDLMAYNPNQMKLASGSLMPNLSPDDWRLKV